VIKRVITRFYREFNCIGCESRAVQARPRVGKRHVSGPAELVVCDRWMRPNVEN
jgi:hypothetical protein